MGDAALAAHIRIGGFAGVDHITFNEHAA